LEVGARIRMVVIRLNPRRVIDGELLRIEGRVVCLLQKIAQRQKKYLVRCEMDFGSVVDVATSADG
jgi:hypothetical protein